MDAGPQVDESWQRSLAIRYSYVNYALQQLGNFTGDVSYYQRALDTALKSDEIFKSLALAHAGEHNATISRSLADGLSNIGWLRWKCCRDLSGSLRDLHESLDRFEILAAADPDNLEARRDVADLNRQIGAVLAEAGRTHEALEPSRKALAIYEQLQRADPTSLENVGYLTEVRARLAALGVKECCQH